MFFLFNCDLINGFFRYEFERIDRGGMTKDRGGKKHLDKLKGSAFVVIRPSWLSRKGK